MHRTIVALYDTRSDAEAAVRDLVTAGFERGAAEIVTRAETVAGTGPVAGDGGPGTGDTHRSGDGFLSRLMGWNVPERDAHVYAEGTRRGGALLKLRVDEEDVDRAVAVLERGNVVDVEQRETAYRGAGWTGYDETAAPYDETAAAEERARWSAGGTGLGGAAQSFRDMNASDATQRDGITGGGVDSDREEVIPVAEEHIDIGKRQVEGGVVRVRSYVTETPVNEQVNLREEHVHVERRAVDRPSDAPPEDAFREREIEMRETAEEAVVRKRAQVKEEIVIRKDVEERAQTVSDTVRRTEVEIDDDRSDAARGDVDRPARRDDVER